jgi:hypothetical protein
MYKIKISTQAYKPMRCSKNTWEKGTVNDFMKALNNWETTENDLAQIKTRLEVFAGHIVNSDKTNSITFYDKLCECNRTENIAPYGFKQGYVKIESIIAELQSNGYVKIPFKAVYDSRQYNKKFNGCYMEIIKI